MSFPATLDQLARPHLDGEGLPENTPFPVTYGEGAAVGYKLYDKRGLVPAFAFGSGLSYGRFTYAGLSAAAADGAAVVAFTVRNAGSRPASDTPQVYVAPPAGAGWEAPQRLAAFAHVHLAPGESRRIRLRVDPRLLAVWEEAAHRWRRRGGSYALRLSRSAADSGLKTAVRLGPT